MPYSLLDVPGRGEPVIVLEPYAPEHLGLVGKFYSDEAALVELMRQKPDYPQILYHGGPAFSGFTESGQYLGSIGMFSYWDRVAKAWMILDERVSRYKVSFHRFVKERVDSWFSIYSLSRLCTDVDASDPRAIRWIESLGFVREGLQIAHGPTLEDYYLYAKVTVGRTPWPE